MAEATKSLAAEIEAVSERERARLIAWLAEHQVSVGSTIDREMTADALMSDFITPRLAEIAALQGRAFEDGARWMRERAKQACETERQASRAMVAVYSDGGRLYAEFCGQADALGAMAATIAALPLQPEGESDA